MKCFVSVIFTKPKSKWNIFSRFVRLIERSEFSHVAFYFYNQNIVVHSTHYRLNAESISLFTDKNQIMKHICVELDSYRSYKLKRFIYENLGKKYGYLTILGVLISRIFKIKNPLADGDKTFFCSEMVARGLKLDKFNPEIDGPQKLYDCLKKEVGQK